MRVINSYGQSMTIQEWADYIGKLRKEWALRKALASNEPFDQWYVIAANQSEDEIVEDLRSH